MTVCVKLNYYGRDHCWRDCFRLQFLGFYVSSTGAPRALYLDSEARNQSQAQRKVSFYGSTCPV